MFFRCTPKMGNLTDRFSLMNSKQKSECQQQINFENEINENIIPKNKIPTELNILHENTVNNNSKELETVTCLQEFDKILDNVCKQNEPIDINTQYDIEIDIEGVNLENDLNTLGDIDNFGNWQNIFDNFVKNTDSNTVHHMNNNEKGINDNDSEIFIDNNKHLNVNNHLDTWKSIYEDFSTKIDDITPETGEDLKNTDVKSNKNVLNELSVIKDDDTYYLNNENRIDSIPKASAISETNLQTGKYNPTDSFKMSSIDMQHKNAVLNFIENHKNKLNAQQIRANLFNMNNNKRFKTEGETNFNRKNTNKFQKEYQGKDLNMLEQTNNKRSDINNIRSTVKCHNEVNTVPNKINENEIIVLISDDEDPLEIVECNTPINKKPTDINKLRKQEQKFNNSEYLNVPANKKPNSDKLVKQENESNNKNLDAHKTIFNTTNEFRNQEPETKCLTSNNISTNINGYDKQEVESNNMCYLEVSATKELINKDELAKEELESNNSECFNIHKQPTIEFEKQEVDSDCDGYNSSDFEFIDEDTARKDAPNFKLLFNESDFVEATTINGPNFKVDTTNANRGLNVEVFSEINGPLPNIETLFAIHDNKKSINFKEFCDENDMIYDYFKTLEPRVNANEFDSSYKESHRIPNEQEFLNLFGENFIPYPMYGFENKATHQTSMSLDIGEVGFDMNMFKNESTQEDRRKAKKTEQKILLMYSTENRRYRRRH